MEGIPGVSAGTWYNLKLHLINDQNRELSPALNIGNVAELRNVAEFNESNVISKCFEEKVPNTYPKLPVKNYLVACIALGPFVKVWGVYTLAQMQIIESQRTSPNHITWYAMKLKDSAFKKLSIMVDPKETLLYITGKEFKELPDDTQRKIAKELVSIAVVVKPPNEEN